MAMMRFAAVMIVLAGWSTTALGQDASAERRESAMIETLLSEARTASEAQRWQEAVDYLRRALSLQDSPRIRYELGSALYQRGRMHEAVEVLRPLAGDGAPAAVTQLLARAETRSSRVQISVSGAPGWDWAVHLDGEPVPESSLGSELAVDPGRHSIALVADGSIVALETLDAAEGQLAEVTLTPPVPPSDEDAEEAVDDGPADLPAPAPVQGGADEGWIWGSVVLAVLLAGAISVAIVFAVEGESGGQPLEGNAGIIRW